MTVTCIIPADTVGVVLRLSAYLDCEGRALGENGFVAVAGGVVGAGLLTGVVTIFVALIGYRLILGHTPSLSDGVTWAARLGLVLALATSWPAFQTLIYRVAADGPDELAAILLPAAGLPAASAPERLQRAYDALRLGIEVEPSRTPSGAVADSAATVANETAPPVPLSRQRTGQPPLPQTASLFVVFTAGVGGALRIALGLLLALGPLVVVGLLFDATVGLVTGWLRALGGTALAMLAASIVTALELAVVDSELVRIAALDGGDASAFDPEALTTIILLFALMMVVATITASRVAGAIRLPLMAQWMKSNDRDVVSSAPGIVGPGGMVVPRSVTTGTAERPARAAAVADAVTAMARRHEYGGTGGSVGSPSSRIAMLAAARRDDGLVTTPLGLAGRRAQPRRSRTATLRDGRR